MPPAVDVWIQHPTLRFLRHEMFEPLLHAAGVSFGLLSAWHAPEDPLIANDKVAGWVSAIPIALPSSRP